MPSTGNRPSVKPPGALRPTTRPSTPPSANRPGGVDRPGAGGNRPGGVDRPGAGGNRPGGVDRPGAGGNRPGIGDRPGAGGNRPGVGDRPGAGGNRPGGGDRPWNNDRPSWGNGNRPGNWDYDRPRDRPVIGGNRPNFGNNTNININNRVNNINNRPRWDVDPGFSRPAWGLGGNEWHHNWHNNSINHHHHWYNGSWGGYWGSSWYAPVAWGAAGWGLGTLTSSWANTTPYYNPYYAEPVVAQAIPYDYSQPVVINNNYAAYDTDGQGGDLPAPESDPVQQQGLSSFDQGLESFKNGDYAQALSYFDAALKQLPGDAVVHEVRSLALFALGDYKAAAAGLNSLLSSAPGMDWTTMSGLYGNPDDYTAQLRKLEQFLDANPNDPSSHFVAAYHYMVIGSKESAIDALRVVVKAQPKDVTARRMLDAMAPPEAPVATRPAPTPAPPAAPASDDVPETDLVGSWVAQAGDTKIELAITEDSEFTWRTSSDNNQTPVELSGQLIGAADGIELETTDQGTMAGSVKSKGPDQWQFAISGAPASDPGLSFSRVK